MKLEDAYKRITVYHFMIAFLGFLGFYNIIVQKSYFFIPQLILAPLTAALVDIAANYYKTKKLFFPQSAIISGLFIALILSQVAFWIPIATAAIAMLSKHVIRYNNRHIFNPASFGIIAAAFLFAAPPAWWGAASILTLPLGLFIAYKIKRYVTSAIFVLTFFALASVLRGSLPQLSSLLDLPVLFFALFMIVEPKTTPYTKKGMVLFGILIAVFAIIYSRLPITADATLLALLTANLFTDFFNKKL